MASRTSHTWSFPGVEYIWPGDSKAQRSPLPRTGSNSNSASSTTTSLSSVTASSYDNSNCNSDCNSTTNNNRSTSQRPTRHVTFDNVSELSDVSASSTKASSGSSIPSSTTTAPSHHGVSLRASRMTKSDARPSGHPAAGPARPAYGLEQQQYAPHQPSHNASQSYQRPPLVSTGSSQQSIFGNPHGIRDRPTLVAQPKPPVVAPIISSSSSNNGSSRSGAPSNVKNPFTSTTPSLNHLGIPGYVGATPSQPPIPMPRQIQMPGAFPTETVIPYRRPTDVSTQLSMSTNDSADHFSNDDVWDSEGDSGSCLSTSTDATTVASDITEKGGEAYATVHTHHAPSSSGTVTPTQSSQQNRHAQMFSGSSHRTPRGPILRRAGHKSVLSTGSKTPSLSSVSSVRSSSTQHSAKASSASTGSNPSTSGTRGSHGSGGGPRIHIEVNRSVQSRESQTDLRKRKMIEEALIGKIEQLKDQGQVRDTSPPSSIASVPSRQGLSVRFAEPEKETEKPRSPVFVAPQQVKPKTPVIPTAPEEAKPQSPAPAPTPTPAAATPAAATSAAATPAAPAPAPVPIVSEQEKNLSKELVLQTREIQKLELEIEKRDVLIREKEKLEQELKLKEKSAALERKTEHERHLEQLQRERTEAERAEKERERAAQKEAERIDREKKAIEKAEREREKEIQKQREQLEREKQEVESAQKEHDMLQASFIEQGKMLSDLKSRFDEQSKTLETTEAERAELQKTRDDFEQKCSNLSRTLSHVSDKERYVVEQVASLQIIKEALQGRVGPLETRVEEQKQEIDGLNKERDGLYQDVKSYLLNITELETQVKSLVEEKRGFIAQVGELEKAKSDLQAEVKDRDGQIATLTENIEARAKEMQEHISSLKDEHTKEVEELQAAKQAQLDGLEQEHTVLVSELEDQIAGLNEHVNGAHLDIDNLKNNITSLEGSLAEERTKSGTLTTERDSILADLEAHKSLAVTQETNVLSLHADIAARDEELASVKETNKSLQAEHEELQQLADSLDDRQTQEQSSFKDLQAKNAELETQITSTKAELEERIKALEGERDTAASALVVAQVELSNAKSAADEATILEEEAGKVPALTSEKAELEGKVADLESHASQVPVLRAHCDKLAEQLSAANKLIEGLTAAAHAGLNTTTSSSTPASPMMTPLSPKLPQDIPVPESPKLAPQRKMRSRAPSMVRSISSRSTVSSRRDKGPKDDMALVIVRDTKDRGSVTVVRKCDLKSPRSRSQPPVKD